MEITRDYGDHRAITVNAKSEIPMRTGLTVIRSKLELMVITNYYRLCSYRGDYSQVLAVVEEEGGG